MAVGTKIIFDIASTGLTEQQLGQEALREAYEAGHAAGLAEGLEKGRTLGITEGWRQCLRVARRVVKRRIPTLRAHDDTSLQLIGLPRAVQENLMRPIGGSVTYSTIADLLPATAKSLLERGLSNAQIKQIDAALKKLRHQRDDQQSTT